MSSQSSRKMYSTTNGFVYSDVVVACSPRIFSRRARVGHAELIATRNVRALCK